MLGLLAAVACHTPRAPDAALALTGDPTRGEARYQMGCAACHGPEGGGIAGAPALRGLPLEPRPTLELMLNGRGGMPAQRLTDQEAADVLAWMHTRWPR